MPHRHSSVSDPSEIFPKSKLRVPIVIGIGIQVLLQSSFSRLSKLNILLLHRIFFGGSKNLSDLIHYLNLMIIRYNHKNINPNNLKKDKKHLQNIKFKKKQMIYAYACRFCFLYIYTRQFIS